MKGLRVHGNREANEQLQHCVTSLTWPSTRKSRREAFVCGSLKRGSNFVLVSFPQRGDGVMVERLQSGWRGVCDAAVLCNAGLWTAARLAPAWLRGGGS